MTRGGGEPQRLSPTPYNDEWWTPPWIFLRMGVWFDLDVCAPSGGVPWVPATYHLERDEDGLTALWFGRVWCNPPYNNINSWLDRMAEHGNGIALSLGDSSTQRFARHVNLASLVCFIDQRIKFVRPGWQASQQVDFSNILIAYGDECGEALIKSGLGVCVRPVIAP